MAKDWVVMDRWIDRWREPEKREEGEIGMRQGVGWRKARKGLLSPEKKCNRR